jgi:hypothetical protein
LYVYLSSPTVAILLKFYCSSFSEEQYLKPKMGAKLRDFEGTPSSLTPGF